MSSDLIFRRKKYEWDKNTLNCLRNFQIFNDVKTIMRFWFTWYLQILPLKKKHQKKTWWVCGKNKNSIMENIDFIYCSCCRTIKKTRLPFISCYESRSAVGIFMNSIFHTQF